MNKSQSCVFRAACAAAFLAAPLARGGNVNAYLDGGDLVICGTSSADNVGVRQIGPSTWRVSSLAGSTKINGSSYQDFDPVYCGIRIDMKGGNDGLVVQDGIIPKSLCIYMGSGNDNVALNNLTIGGYSIVAEGLQSEEVSSSGGYLRLKGDDGNDSLWVNNLVVLYNAYWSPNTVDSDLLTTKAQTSGGSSSKWSTIAGCSGNDRIVVQNFQVKKLEVTGGSGKDDVAVQVGSLPNFGCERFCIDTGSDTDQLKLNMAFAEKLMVEVGPGKSDKVNVVGTFADCAEFEDCGTNGFITGAASSFNSLWIDSNFTHVSGTFITY
ncbi:hypothetical protein [Luteolibacter sp. LG18]|uniref:hypothetical protein n=1 Tax=Luteolibacter sp. LG18 TaxID=2819286 RepID=UPI002B31F21E|nr:hypothetical protein llg_02170 [Luteolibacter sp. LG18]